MARPEASILIPFSPRDEWSWQLFEAVKRHWEVHFPEWEIVVGHSGDPFNRSSARNQAASSSSAGVMIFCDADTLFGSPYDIEKAVGALAAGTGPAWYGCDVYYMFCKQYTVDKLNNEKRSKAGVPWEKTLQRPPGGIAICRRSDFEAIGGYDEAFRGWGYEDSAFSAAMTALVGAKGVFGDVFHLWHPKQRSDRQEQPNIAFNKRRYGLYFEACQKGPEAMNTLLSSLRKEANCG